MGESGPITSEGSKAHENLTYRVSYTRNDVYSTCLLTYLLTDCSPVALSTSLSFASTWVETNINIIIAIIKIINSIIQDIHIIHMFLIVPRLVYPRGSYRRGTYVHMHEPFHLSLSPGQREIPAKIPDELDGNHGPPCRRSAGLAGHCQLTTELDFKPDRGNGEPDIARHKPREHEKPGWTHIWGDWCENRFKIGSWVNSCWGRLLNSNS